MSAREWSEKYYNLYPPKPPADFGTKPKSNLDRPGLLRQFLIFMQRDMSSKIANRQYVLLTMLEAPVLGFILSYIIRYIADPESNIYIFRENVNIPVFIFMSLIVALFLGLITSAEEIFKDRKIRNREQFLHLSKGSYLSAKIVILFSISALQAFFFIIIANPILGIKGLTFQYWFALFTTATCANLLGLNVSSSFNSAITIYIVVPLLMIPMMVLSGAMFPFDKLNRNLGSIDKVPWIAEIMPTKWTYEALMVTQFKDNEYNKLFYEWEKNRSIANYNTAHRLNELENALNKTVLMYRRDQLSEENPAKLELLRNEVEKLSAVPYLFEFEESDKINPVDFNHILAEKLSVYLDSLNMIYNRMANSIDVKIDNFKSANREKLDPLYNGYHNDQLEEVMRKILEPNKILEYKNSLIQNYDPIYKDPMAKDFPYFRSHFFAPSKVSLGIRFDTYTFNMLFVWLMSLALYIMLYFNLFEKIVKSLSRK